MKCTIKNRDRIIDDYLQGKLTQEEKDKFDAHCFECDACFTEIRFREKLVNLIQQDGPVLFADYLKIRSNKQSGLPEKFRILFESFHKFKSHRVGFAAAAFAAIALFTLLTVRNLNLINETSVPSVLTDGTEDSVRIDAKLAKQDSSNSSATEPAQVAVSKTQRKAQPTELPTNKEIEKKTESLKRDLSETLAANFKPLPYLEAMLNDVSRSANLTVISPEINQQMQDSLRFSWRSPDSEKLYLKILNNKGSELFAFTVESNQYLFSQKLKPGLYYWKLENEDDLLFVGKFVVGKVN